MTKPKIISKTAVLKSISKAVKERGADYRYKEHHAICRYVNPAMGPDKATASCLVGVVLNDLGVPLDVLARHNAQRIMARAAELDAAGFCIKNDALAILQVAQYTQDTNGSWGEARRDARAEAADLRRDAA